jgi:DNA-binding SARP family transcriptional activator/transcriptional regulator with XRE-family HTH domain
MDLNSDGGLDGIVRDRRRAAGLTQRQLADAARVSIGVVRDLEQGLTSRPRATSMTRLAAVLGLGSSGAELGRLQLGAWPAAAHRDGQRGRRPAGAAAIPRTSLPRAGRLHLQILGPLAAVRDGVPIAIEPTRHRMVLGLLAASPNCVVSRSQLADALWGDSPPRHAATMIQSYVSALRRVLDPAHPARGRDGLIVSAGSGYRLSTGGIELDLDVFHELVARGRAASEAGDAAACCRAYADALALWRGEPLSDIESLAHHPAVTGLARQRDRAVTDYAEAAASMGWYDRPLHQLELLIEREPFNERAFACYMIALAGTGQHAAALHAFEQVRDRLRNDLGLAPGPELRATHARVLQQQVPASAPAFQVNGHPPVYQLPAPVADFTGRAEETAALARLLAGGGRPAPGRAVVLTGMPGIGKTALALRIAQELRPQFRHGQLWTRLTDRSGRPRDPADVLAELLRALYVPGPAIPGSTEERASLYRSLLASRQILVVADDASCADQIGPLLPGSGDSAILVTSQSEMASPAGSHLHQMGALTTDEALELLGKIIGADRVAADAVASLQLIAACGGLPLAVRIIGMRLAARKSWQLGALLRRLAEPQRRLSELSFGGLSLRASFARSYDGLSERSQRVFRHLSLLDDAEFAEAAVAAALGERGADDAAAVLADRSLLTSVGIGADGSPRYRLQSLLRDYAAELHQAHRPAAPRGADRDPARSQGGEAASASGHEPAPARGRASRVDAMPVPRAAARYPATGANTSGECAR